MKRRNNEQIEKVAVRPLPFHFSDAESTEEVRRLLSRGKGPAITAAEAACSRWTPVLPDNTPLPRVKS